MYAGDFRKPLLMVAHDVGPYGGQEKALESFVLDAASAGVEVHVIAFKTSPAVAKNAMVKVVPRPLGPFICRFVWFWFYSMFVARGFGDAGVVSCGAITGRRVDAIWMHFWHMEHLKATGWLCSWQGSCLRYASQSVARFVALLAEAWVLGRRRPQLIISVSDSQAKALRRKYGETPVVVIPNPVSTATDEFISIPKDERLKSSQHKRVIFVGGQWGHKGLQLVAEAANVAAIRQREVLHLKIIGQGPKELLAVVSRMPNLIVEHINWSDDVAGHLHDADLFALASKHETFSMAGHEALGVGLPVVTTSVHGLADATVGAGLGVVCERSVEPLAVSISDVLWIRPYSDSQRVRAAKWIARKFSPQSISAARLSVIDLIC